MKKAPEDYRDRRHPLLKSTAAEGNNGCFVFPHPWVTDYEIRCIISDGMGWEHVSITIAHRKKNPSRNPTWDEMCWVKDQFWSKDETVVQFHPREEDYVNCHPFCLHLWKKVGVVYELPLSIMVGPKKQPV